MRAMLIVVLLVGLVPGVDLFSQELPTAAEPIAHRDEPRFTAGVDVVKLNVVVTDGRQQVVRGLAADAFEVVEDGVTQTVSFFATESVPTDLAVIVDSSASMWDKMTSLQRAATGFLKIVKPDDRIMIVGVSNRPTVLHPLDGSPRDAAAAILRAQPGGNTALYNGVYLAIHELAKQTLAGEVRHQVLTVFSDGQDTKSIVAFEDVLEQAKRVGLSVYTMLLQTPAATKSQLMNRDRAKAAFAMKDLARETGGLAFFPATMSEVPNIYNAIAADIAGRYTLGYVSTNRAHDARYRQVKVRIKGVAAQARTRRGYYAAEKDHVVRGTSRLPASSHGAAAGAEFARGRD